MSRDLSRDASPRILSYMLCRAAGILCEGFEALGLNRFKLAELEIPILETMLFITSHGEDITVEECLADNNCFSSFLDSITTVSELYSKGEYALSYTASQLAQMARILLGGDGMLRVKGEKPVQPSKVKPLRRNTN